MLPTSFSLRLYCGEPARAPPGRCSPPRSLCGCTAESLLALLLVDAPHLVLSAVVLRTACSRSLAHFLRAPPSPHVPCALCGCTAESLLVLLLVLTFLALFPRAPLEHPQV